jgi:hypothetical protein
VVDRLPIKKTVIFTLIGGAKKWHLFVFFGKDYVLQKKEKTIQVDPD